jgi:hypothetical protein
MAEKPTLKERLKLLFAEYGKLAIAVYVVLYALTVAVLLILVQAGFEIEGATEGATAFGAIWFATRLSTPFRIAATLALTPIVSALIKRFRSRGKIESPPGPS